MQLIAEYQECGLTQKEFVAKHELPFNTFQYWLYRASKKVRAESGSEQRFLPVELVPSPALLARGTEVVAAPAKSMAADFFEVKLRGIRVRFAAGTSAKYVVELVSALK